jgi:uncharacterized protein (TIGR03067 family)
MTKYVVTVLVAGLLLAADEKKDDAKKEQEKLQGSWDAVSVEFDGKATAVSDPKKFTLTFEKDTLTLKMKGKDRLRGTFRLDPAATPKIIDITVSAGGKDTDDGKVMHGIYEVDKDGLKFCAGEPGEKERPKGFNTEGTGHTLFTFKRAAEGPREDREPPLLFYLESSGKKTPIELDKPFKTAALGDTATLRVEPYRVFPYAGPSFHYPRNYTFEAASEGPLVSRWIVQGTDCTITILRFKDQPDHEAARRRYVKAVVANFKTSTEHKESEAALELKGATLKGSLLHVVFGGGTIHAEVYSFSSGKDAVVLALQDIPKEGGKPSDDRVNVGKMLRDTLRLPKE